MSTFFSVSEARGVLVHLDSDQRASTLTYLSSQSYSGRTEDMIAHLSDPDISVVVQAIGGLIGQSDDRALAALITMLESEHSILVQAATLALGRHGDQRAMVHLLGKLGHKDWQMRRCSVHALAQLGGPQALLALHAALFDCHRDVRFAAASFLGALDLRSYVNG